jgi:hypothetical protein
MLVGLKVMGLLAFFSAGSLTSVAASVLDSAAGFDGAFRVFFSTETLGVFSPTLRELDDCLLGADFWGALVFTTLVVFVGGVGLAVAFVDACFVSGAVVSIVLILLDLFSTGFSIGVFFFNNSVDGFAVLVDMLYFVYIYIVALSFNS